MGDMRFLKRGFRISRLEGASSLGAVIDLKLAAVLSFLPNVGNCLAVHME